MISTAINPENREHWLSLRKTDITSTDVSALFGISPYLTIYELWHRKKNSIDSGITQNERMKWGNLLEPVIASEIGVEQGWSVSPLKCYMRIEELRMGSSFDFSIDGDEPGILEIKNVDRAVFNDSWTKKEDGGYEAPLHIEIQVQHQLAVSGRKFAYIGALIGGNDLVLIRRDRDEGVIEAIKQRVSEFWASVEAGKEPEPDFSKDAAFISKLFGFAEPDKVIDVKGDSHIRDLAIEYRDVSREITSLEEKKEGLKAQLLMCIGDAEKTTGDGFTISAGMIGECPISYTRKGYRSFRINWKKVKEDK